MRKPIEVKRIKTKPISNGRTTLGKAFDEFVKTSGLSYYVNRRKGEF